MVLTFVKTGGKLVIHIGQGKTLECENAKVMEKGSQSLIAEHGLAENYVKEKIGNKVAIFDMEGKILVKGHIIHVIWNAPQQ